MPNKAPVCLSKYQAPNSKTAVKHTCTTQTHPAHLKNFTHRVSEGRLRFKHKQQTRTATCMQPKIFK